MSALEQEIIHKFKQLDDDSRHRVLIALTKPEMETRDPLASLLELGERVQADARAHQLPQKPTLQEMLDELRGNDE